MPAMTEAKPAITGERTNSPDDTPTGDPVEIALADALAWTAATGVQLLGYNDPPPEEPKPAPTPTRARPAQVPLHHLPLPSEAVPELVVATERSRQPAHAGAVEDAVPAMAASVGATEEAGLPLGVELVGRINERRNPKR
jgi:hypothetical protein